MAKNNNKVSLTRKTTTTIYKMSALNGLRSSSVTEVTEVIEVAEELGLDMTELRSAEEARLFRRRAKSFMDSCWFGISDE